MPRFDDVSAWVEVEGRRLEEYQVEVDHEDRMVTCYVVSEVGKAFAVRWLWDKKPNVTKAELKVDGLLAAELISHDQDGCADRMDLENDGSGGAARLAFGHIELTDDEDFAVSDESIIKALGTIDLNLEQGRESASESAPPDPDETPSPKPEDADDDDDDDQSSNHSAVVDTWDKNYIGASDAIRPIYERVKKAVSHRVVRGESVEPWSAFCGAFIADEEYAPVVFKFVYRSKDLLLAQGIVPNEAILAEPEVTAATGVEQSNQTVSVKREEDGNGQMEEEEEADVRRARAVREELEELEERMKARKLRAELAAIEERLKKRKGKEPEGSSKKQRVGTTASSSSSTIFKRGEVIDLTD